MYIYIYLYSNDKIKVLLEDGRDWWMGQLEDGVNKDIFLHPMF